MKVNIVGGGLSGLLCAYYLNKRGLSVRVIEAQDHYGGLIATKSFPEGFAETAANGLLSHKIFEDLAQDIGLEILTAKKSSKRRYIFRGTLKRWPLSVWETLSLLWKFLWSRPRAPFPKESIKDWGCRVLGAPAVDFLIGPALRGIYAGEPQKMSATLILGRFFASKKTRAPRGAIRGLVSFKKGMGQLVEHLVNALKARRVEFQASQALEAQDLAKKQNEVYLLCTSPYAAAALIKERFPESAELLRQIEMLPLTTVTQFYQKAALKKPGFGCLFPASEKFNALGVLFNTSIFEGRARKSLHSETWIFRSAQLSELELLKAIAEDRFRIAGDIENPEKTVIQVWPQALPHYTLGLENILEKLPRQKLQEDGIFLFGNYLGHLGLSKLIAEAEKISEIMATNMERPQSQRVPSEQPSPGALL